MGFSNWQDWYGAIDIRHTTRPYFRQSILLVDASRSIQVHFRTLSTDEEELQLLLEHVSEALKAARSPKVRSARKDFVDKVFERAYENVHNFCEKHQIRIEKDMDLAIMEDQVATNCLEVVTGLANKAEKLAKSKETTKLGMTFWPINLNMQKPNIQDDNLYCELKIESDIKLNHVLARLLQKSMFGKDGLPRLYLIQNPGFFTVVPETRLDFGEKKQGRSGGHKQHESGSTFLCQLDLHETIGHRWADLHVLLDPPTVPESELTWFDSKNQAIIKRNYSNIWRLREGVGGGRFAAAREISGCLVCLNPEEPVPLPIPPIFPPKLPQRPHTPPPGIPTQAGPSKSGWFSRKTRPANDPLTQPPPQPPPQPTPEQFPDVYRSHNAMDYSLKLKPVDIEFKKSRWKFW